MTAEDRNHHKPADDPDELAVQDLLTGPHSAEGQIEREAAGHPPKFRPGRGADVLRDVPPGSEQEHGEGPGGRPDPEDEDDDDDPGAEAALPAEAA